MNILTAAQRFCSANPGFRFAHLMLDGSERRQPDVVTGLKGQVVLITSSSLTKKELIQIEDQWQKSVEAVAVSRETGTIESV